MSANLREIQRALSRAIRDSRAEIPAGVSGDQRASAQRRLTIYRDAYQARIGEALAADFPALHAYLGDEGFARLARDYSAAYPARSFSLRWLGQELCTFLNEHTPYRDHVDVCELARFEWILCHAFDAADAAPVNAAALSRFAPELWPRLTLGFHASATSLTLRGNTVDQWRALNARQTPPVFEQREDAPTWLVWRRDLQVLYRPLEFSEADALVLFMRGENFATVCGQLASVLEEEQVPARAAAWLGQWVGDGLVIHVDAD